MSIIFDVHSIIHPDWPTTIQSDSAFNAQGTEAAMYKFATTPAIRPAFILVIATFVLLLSHGCSCTDKKRKDSKPGAVAATSPTPTPTPTTPVEKDVGVEVPPFVPDKVAVIDTTDAPGVFHFKFETPASGGKESARYLMEYLLVVRANEDSCFRLKVRPSAGISDEVSGKDFADKGVEACAGIDEALKDAATPPSPSPTPSPSGSPAATLTGPSMALNGSGGSGGSGGLGGSNKDSEERFKGLEWGVTNSEAEGFGLASNTREICDRRLFRMITKNRGLGGNAGLETITTKTGRLVYQTASKKVSVWVDDEFSDMCSGVTPVDGKKVSFGPLLQEGSSQVTVSDRDQLTRSHLGIAGDELEKSLTALTTLYGGISDIDGSTGVDLFISPEVNRLKLTNALTHAPDHFRAQLMLKPEDLARYNTVTNPTSNEGEVVYLWAPDPGGLYLYGEYPTANSITSNYAIGYMAAQIMTLIITNKHMIERKDKPMEKMWLVEALALLGASYRGGNDYPFGALAQYLSSRPQHLGLTENLDLSRFPPELHAMAGDELTGLRGVFGWYLHSRLCDATVNPCAKIKDLIDTDQTGEDNIKAVLGEPISEVLKNFGISVALGLLEHPETAKAYWNTTPLPPGTPKAPYDLPVMAEVRADDPPQTYEHARDASGEYSASGNRIDRTQASPYTSRDALIFQPLLPDNEMDIKPAKNSVTYILVTGFIDKITDATAVLGKGLNVAVIPIGDRDTSMRQIVNEKVGENAHRDLRPYNLTSSTDAALKRTRTYYADPTYPELGSNLTINPKRELWIMGSIDNYTVAEIGSSVDIGDSDAYNIYVNPCDGLSGAALTTCRSQYHQVIVQAIPRDFDKQLEPSMLLTSTQLSIFRGAAVFGRIQEADPEIETLPQHFDFLCQSDVSQGGTSYFNCANGGVRPTPFQTHITTNFPNDNLLGTSAIKSAAFYDDFNWQINDTYAVTYDNFLFSGPNGYPFYNNDTMEPLVPTPRGIYRSFRPIETERQFFRFKYDATTLANAFSFYTTEKDADLDPTLTKISPETLGTLVAIKSAVDTNLVGPTGQTFIDNCTALGITDTYCTYPSANRVALQNEALGYIANSRPKIICWISGTATRANCAGYALTQPSVDGTGSPPSYWIKPNRLITLASASTGNNVPSSYTTWYAPMEPYDRNTRCAGELSPGNDTMISHCTVKESIASLGSDIRRQINVPASAWDWADCDIYLDDWKVCGDPYSLYYDLNNDNVLEPGFYAKYEALSTDRARQRMISIARRAGEVVGKPKRIHQATYWVKGNQPEILHVLLGGRAMTQGKYLLRVRQKTFDLPKTSWPALVP